MSITRREKRKEQRRLERRRKQKKLTNEGKGGQRPRRLELRDQLRFW